MEISTPQEIAVRPHFHVRHGTTQYFYLLIEKPFGRYFQVWSPYYQAAQCYHKTPLPVSSKRQVRSEKAKKRQLSTLITSTPQGISIVTISLEGWPTKDKKAPSLLEVRLTLLDTSPVFQCLGDISRGLSFLFFLIEFNVT